MLQKYLISAVLILVTAMPTSAFDSIRKGFILGGGIGFAPVAKWNVDADFFGLDLADYEEEKTGVALHLLIGGAFSEHDMLVYETNITGFESNLEDWSVVQGFSGASWYHYFGSAGRSAFASVGLGVYYFGIEDFEEPDPGFALLIGGGYEFARHWQIGGYLTFGNTSESAFGIDASFEHANLSILVSTTAY